MNSFQAIQKSKTTCEHKITIVTERERELFVEEDQPISGFEISDTGVEFNEENFNSFNTAYSEHKVDQGGRD